MQNLGGGFLDGFAGCVDHRDLVFMEETLGLVQFIDAGSQAGISAVSVALAPDAAQQLGRCGQADHPVKVQGDAVRHPVPGKIFLGQREVGGLEA